MHSCPLSRRSDRAAVGADAPPPECMITTDLGLFPGAGTNRPFLRLDKSASGGAVNEFAQDVGVPGVAAGFLDQVGESPA